jgi:hypothetical protein
VLIVNSVKPKITVKIKTMNKRGSIGSLLLSNQRIDISGTIGSKAIRENTTKPKAGTKDATMKLLPYFCSMPLKASDIIE